MKVETNSPKVEKQRKMLTALLLADHPSPCAKEQTTGGLTNWMRWDGSTD